MEKEDIADEQLIDQLCDQFEAAYGSGKNPDLTGVLNQLDSPQSQAKLLREILLLELEKNPKKNVFYKSDLKRYLSLLPKYKSVVLEAFKQANTVTKGLNTTGVSPSKAGPAKFVKPEGNRIGDYQLEGEIARGGMGVVYKATQVSLGRPVALKMILSFRWSGEEQIQRFLAEADAAAKLDHPGIVPVYEVGEFEGQHFFTMGLVEGGTLEKTVQKGPLTGKQAARLAIRIADAVQYAHSRNIVHRDLKPSNVLLDSNGRPKVTDFGLAKNMEEDTGLTATGAVMGTPGFMAPEQAAGRVNEVGTLADVYSLGAILYFLVTGKPPIEGKSVMESLQKIMTEDPVSPQQLNPSIDADLATICLKCLEKTPSKRYASAGELVGELKRYLRGIPITARPIGNIERGWRWCKRNPLGATVLGLVAFLAIAGPIVISNQVQINRRLEQALEGEKEQKQLALSNEAKALDAADKLKKALSSEQAALKEKDTALEEKNTALKETEEAIQKYVKTVNESELLKEPRFRKLLQELLKDALRYYERLVDNLDANPDVQARRRVAMALQEIGTINYAKGSIEEASEAFRQSQELFELLAKENPSEIDFLYQSAQAICRQANSQLLKGNLLVAMDRYQQALQVLDPLASKYPERGSFQYLQAITLMNLGSVQRENGKIQKELEYHQKAQVIFERLVQEHPSEKDYQDGLATLYDQLGKSYRQLGSPDQELKLISKAYSLRNQLARNNPAKLDYQNGLVKSCLRLGSFYSRLGQTDRVKNYYDQALTVQKKLADENPTVTAFQSQLADVFDGLGSHYIAVEEFDKALSYIKDALDLRRRQARDNPNVSNYKVRLAISLNKLGSLYYEMDRHDEAASQFKEGIILLQDLVRESPGQSYHNARLGTMYNNLVRANLVNKNYEQADEIIPKPRSIFEQLTSQHPLVLDFQAGFADHYYLAGRVSEELDREKSAIRDYEKSLKITESLVRKKPGVLSYRMDLARTLRVLGMRLNESGESEKALEVYRQALAIRIKLTQEHPKSAKYKKSLRYQYQLFAKAYKKLGRKKEETKFLNLAAQVKKEIDELE